MTFLVPFVKMNKFQKQCKQAGRISAVGPLLCRSADQLGTAKGVAMSLGAAHGDINPGRPWLPEDRFWACPELGNNRPYQPPPANVRILSHSSAMHPGLPGVSRSYFLIRDPSAARSCSPQPAVGLSTICSDDELGRGWWVVQRSSLKLPPLRPDLFPLPPHPPPPSRTRQ